MKPALVWSLLCVLATLGLPTFASANTPGAGSATPLGGESSARDKSSERVTFAVVIGNNKSLGRRRPDLHYADDDAARYFEILQTVAPGRVSLLAEFDRDTQRLFPNAATQARTPKRTALLGIGKQLTEQVRTARQAGKETELYFVFAGHGDVAHGQGFIEMADERFGSDDLKQWLTQIPFTRAHVILDSCNSFFMLGVRKPGGRHFVTAEDAAQAMASRLSNVGVFLSTSAEGEAYEWSEIQSGIFSHVVRSGLLGAADANGDGVVSYLELAAFVDTATTGVRNPNMRPHVFARGPGAANDAPIARVKATSSVRRFRLSDAEPLRIRVRDALGVPLLDAHTERAASLELALPQAWAEGASLERSNVRSVSASALDARHYYSVPQGEGTITLAALQPSDPNNAARGPDETFQSLFSQPFGPRAVASYREARRVAPPPVYGVSREDVTRMKLVLDEIARTERARRQMETVGTLAFGAYLTGTGISVAYVDPELSDSRKRRDRIIGGSMIGLGSLFLIGGLGSTFVTTPAELAAAEFRRAIALGMDPTQAFAAADKRLQEFVKKLRTERTVGIVFGALAIAGSSVGLMVNEFSDADRSQRTNSRLSWGGGMLLGTMLLGSSIIANDSPAEALIRIWRDDPSLNQYQPSVTISANGAGLSLIGQF